MMSFQLDQQLGSFTYVTLGEDVHKSIEHQSPGLLQATSQLSAGGHGSSRLRGGFGACGHVLDSSPILCRGDFASSTQANICQ